VAPELCNGRAHGPDRALHVRAHHHLQLRVAAVEDAAVHSDAGADDDAVQPAEAFDGSRDQLVGAARVLDVTGHNENVVSAEFVRECVETFPAPRLNRDLGSRLEQQPSSRGADTRTGAGNGDDGVGDFTGFCGHESSRWLFRLASLVVDASPTSSSRLDQPKPIEICGYHIEGARRP
jgi:hypothetical protein